MLYLEGIIQTLDAGKITENFSLTVVVSKVFNLAFPASFDLSRYTDRGERRCTGS